MLDCDVYCPDYVMCELASPIPFLPFSDGYCCFVSLIYLSVRLPVCLSLHCLSCVLVLRIIINRRTIPVRRRNAAADISVGFDFGRFRLWCRFGFWVPFSFGSDRFGSDRDLIVHLASLPASPTYGRSSTSRFGSGA